MSNWQHGKHRLIVRVDCRTSKQTLENGNYGWGSTCASAWVCSWTLVSEVWVTEPWPGYPWRSAGYPVPAQSGSVRRFPILTGAARIEIAVCEDCVEVMFPIPECIRSLSASKLFGASGAGPIILSGGLHHCRARVQAISFEPSTGLRRVGGGLEFFRLHEGRETIICRLEDRIETPASRMRRFRALTQ